MNLMEGKTAEELKQGIIDQYQKAIDSMQFAVDQDKRVPALVSSQYIVIVEGLAVNPKVENGKVEKGSVSVGLPHEVRRFSKENAEIVAEHVTNGNNSPGVVVHWLEATKQKIEEYKVALRATEEML